jgi:hypothetical protein
MFSAFWFLVSFFEYLLFGDGPSKKTRQIACWR